MTRPFTQIEALAVLAKEVMELLERHGEQVVPHLLDSDDNAGQFLREAIDNVLVPDFVVTDTAVMMARPDNNPQWDRNG